jgi:catechol 2,3-dioxygenase-like lactoylglutathione lyase family enzyme
LRKVGAGTLGTIGVFVILFGAGLARWAIIALGGALLVIAIALVAFPAMRGGARSWVAGSAHVVSASEPPASSTYGRCELQIVVDAPGLPAAAVKVRDPRVPVAKWPDAGATLPILVAVDDPRHVRIQWDDVLTHAEAAAEEEIQAYEDAQTERIPVVHGDLFDTQGIRPDDGLGGTLDLADDVDGIHAEERPRDPSDREPVIVTHTPAGPVVEGRIVDPAAAPPPPPRRAEGAGPLPRRKPSPRRRRDEPAVDAATTAATAATAAARAGAAAANGDGAAGPSGGNGGRGGATTATAPQDDDISEFMTAYPSARPGPAGAIHGVGITMLVTDLARSIAFYCDMLGFFEIDGGEGNAVLASGDTRLVLRTIPDVAPMNRRVVHLNLEVGDVEATYEELKAKGVKFTYGPRPVNKGERLELWAAAFRDPDGHGIAITQWRARPADD